MLLTEARVLLLYDPTRGVDVGTKGEIFQLMRDLAAKGYAILFYSSDLPELVHVADRVAGACANGRIAATLDGDAHHRGGHPQAPPCSKARRPEADGADSRRHGASPPRSPRRAPTGAAVRSTARPFLVACLMLVVLVAIYGIASQTGVFTLDELNLDTAAAMTLMLAATGQTIVLLRGGIDLSIGGMISLGTVIAATRFGDDPVDGRRSGALAILALGFGVGALNGLLISVLRLQPFLVTLATWSILTGAALLILPTDGGSVPGWLDRLRLRQLPRPVEPGLDPDRRSSCSGSGSARTRLGITIRATGSNEKSAFLSGVSITRINVADLRPLRPLRGASPRST